MFSVTSTLIVHRPERYLYYIPQPVEENDAYIAEGVCPEQLEKYRFAFGTYDDVSVCYLPKKLQEETGLKVVLGIEFRKDDPAVQLPEELPSVIIPESDMLLHSVSFEEQLKASDLETIVNEAGKIQNERTEKYAYVSGGIVTVCYNKAKLRVLYEAKPVSGYEGIEEERFEEYSKQELYYLAYHEPITGYYNWKWMGERLETYFLNGIKDYGFVHFDIKDYKMINELYSHRVGNYVLKRVTDNMERHRDWIYFGARCDNDNFAMMIHDMPEEEIKEKLYQFFEEISVLEEDPSYRIYYRCGVVNMRNSMNMGDIVADCAKLAQSFGTALNVTEINFYTNDMHENVLWGKHLKAYLDKAISEKEFLVYLQPKINARSEQICGAEALVRWDYKHKELLTPFRFVPYFETDGSIIKVDEVVLHYVCMKIKEWKENGYTIYPVSVNLSRKHVEQPGLVKYLTDIVDSYGVEHSLIEFELTESAAADNQGYMVSVMDELKKQGFLISMDDFGTGYSSFALLKEMPLDILKIDKSFVDMIMAERDSEKIQIILRHIIAMARELGVHCVAEGVEEYEQVLALRNLGCDTIQGYYYSKPVPIEKFEEKYLK